MESIGEMDLDKELEMESELQEFILDDEPEALPPEDDEDDNGRGEGLVLGPSEGKGKVEDQDECDGQKEEESGAKETEKEEKQSFFERLASHRIWNRMRRHIRMKKENISDFLMKQPGQETDGDMTVTYPNGTLRYLLLQKPGTGKENEKITDDVQPEALLSMSIADLRSKFRANLDEKWNERNLALDEELFQNGGQKWNRSLFVNKYAPKSFMDLVSDERLNRNVMQWLLSWNSFVFDRKRDSRPECQVILLAGPPGCGKTTLAHVAAKHAGYNVVEVNASDERTGPVIENRLINAMEMQNSFGKRKSFPNCIILDECEGVTNAGEGKGPIQMLLDMMETQLPSELLSRKRGSNGEQVKTASKKKKNVHAITRPVILICNDAYAPVLRPIRQRVEVFNFRSVKRGRVVQRLKEICTKENIEPSRGALELLSERMGDDIRACLHILQFLISDEHSQRRKGQKTKLTREKIESSAAGTKDETANLFRSWETVFRNNNKLHQQQQKFRKMSNSDFRLFEQSQVLTEFDALSNDFGKFLDGIHENMGSAKLVDRSMRNVHSAIEKMSEADVLLKRIDSKQQWILSKFLAPAGLGLKRTLRSESRPRLSFPSQGFDAYMKRKQNEEILSTFAEGRRLLIPGQVVGTRLSTVLDLLSPLMDIIHPAARPLQFSLLRPEEKDSVMHVVDVMVSLGLVLKETAEDVGNEPNACNQFGEDNFRVSVENRPFPRVDKLLSFDQEDFHFSRLHKVPMKTICMILTTKIRQQSGKQTSSKLHSSDGFVEKRSWTQKVTIEDSIKKKVPRDIFGRPLAAKKTRTHEKGANTEIEDASEIGEKRRLEVVKYKFQEGFTNAVRRPVFMDAFLG